MRSEKIVFFEEITPPFYSIMKKYLQDDFKIYSFKIDNKYKERRDIKKYLNAKQIIDVSKIIFEAELTSWAAFYAHENIDYIFNKYYSSSPSIKLMERLFISPRIRDMYKKEILLVLGKIYNIELKINETIKKNNGLNEVHFIPSGDFKIHSDKISKLGPKIKTIPIKNLKVRLNYILNKFKRIFFLGAPINIFFKKLKKISNNKKIKEFKVGITIDHPVNIFLMNYYTETILIDEKELPKENVLFIDEVGQVNLKDYNEQGYNYTNLSDDREIISSDLFWNKIIKRFFPIWLKSIFVSFPEDFIIIETTRKILSDYIRWHIFVDNYKIKNYVKKLIPDNISKTYKLSQNNVRTWLYHPDCTPADFHIDWDEKKKNQTLYSFAYYDNGVICSDIIERYFKKHRNFINKYIKSGVLFSQIIYELKNGRLKSTLKKIVKAKKLPDKIIGIFDTTFVDWGPIKIKDGIKFGNDILNILKDFPDIGIIFKAKKELELTSFLKPIYEKLKNHERCIFIARYDKEGISVPEVIAQSNLVISAAYTSPTGEALGAKVKAIYYEPGGHHIGEKYYLNRIPNLVAHNYGELEQLINYWLHEITDEEFENFLENYVKDEIDPYLDGKSLTRFRKLLME